MGTQSRGKRQWTSKSRTKGENGKYQAPFIKFLSLRKLLIHPGEISIKHSYNNNCLGTPRWLSGWASAFGSGCDPGGSWHRVLQWAPCKVPASPSVWVSLPLSVSLMNRGKGKGEKKKEKKENEWTNERTIWCFKVGYFINPIHWHHQVNKISL